MEKKLIEKHLFESSHQDVEQRTNISSAFLAVLLILLSAVSLIVYSQLDRVAAAITLTLLFLAGCFLLIGIYILFWKSKILVYGPTGSKVMKESLFFEIGELNKLEKMIKSGVFTRTVQSNEKGSVRLDILKSEDGKFVALQLFQFSLYKFTVNTPITYFHGEQAEEVSAFLRKLG